jgi:hypothetical protein
VSWSIRARLSLSYSALVLAVLATAAAVIASMESQRNLAGLDGELKRLEMTVVAVVLNEFGEGLDLPGAAKEASTQVVMPGRIFVVAQNDRSSVRIWGGDVSASWRPDILSPDEGATPVTVNGSRYRMVSRRVTATDHPFIVAVLASMAPLEEDQRSLFRTLTIGIAAALSVAVLGGLLIGKLALRPLSAMAVQAAALGELIDGVDPRPISQPFDDIGQRFCSALCALPRIGYVDRARQPHDAVNVVAVVAAECGRQCLVATFDACQVRAGCV